MYNSKLVGKFTNLNTCLDRIRTVYDGDRAAFLKEEIRQESVLLNFQRACENAIDMSNHVAAELDLGVPASAREGFELLENAGIITPDLAEKRTEWSVFATFWYISTTKLT